MASLTGANAGDEIHLDENWWQCSLCRYDNTEDYDACTFCGADRSELEVEA